MGFFDRFKKKNGSGKSEPVDPSLGTIVDIAVADGEFKTLVAAAKAAGLADTLSGKGPFTVFAPRDIAFLMLPDGTVDGLMKDKAKLKGVLTYHVVPERLSYDDLKKKSSVKTVQGGELAIDTKGLVKVGGATIIQGSIKCRNGYIHVVDKVLMP